MKKIGKGIANKKTIATVFFLLIIGIISGTFMFFYNSSKANESVEKSIMEVLKKERSNILYKKSHSIFNLEENNDGNNQLENEQRIIIELKEEAALDNIEEDNSTGTSKDIYEYNKNKKKEEKIIEKSKKDLVNKIEKITGNKIVDSTEYLVNTITIDATKKEMQKIDKLDEVKKVYETTEYLPQINDSKIVCNINKISEDYGYKGDETVVAVVDTGINYKHQDMKMSSDAKVKYSKEEWLNNISLLGYGSYLSDKVPFGYDYIYNQNVESAEIDFHHGSHVAGIVGANGGIQGIAPNTQVLDMKALGVSIGGGTSELVRSIEDSVKLGADVINMSLGSDSGLTSSEDYIQKAIEKASKAGVLVCVAAGNSGTNDGMGITSNITNMIDTSTINSPSTEKTCLSVAAADITKNNGVDAYTMASFTAWGATNDLAIKPEITAPGVSICSIYDGNEYTNLDGTSMATPFVSGAATLVINDIKKNNLTLDGQSLQGEELTRYIKNILMNTSEPIIDVTNYDESRKIPYSIRSQGAGLINVENAIKNKVTATCNNEAKIELGEINNEEKEFEITLTNYGDSEVTYLVTASDVYRNIRGENSCAIINDSSGRISFDVDSVTVQAKESVKIKGYINISSNFIKNSFVEAYIKFKGEGVVDLCMPLLGFYGSWIEEPLVDYPIYDNSKSYLEQIKCKNYYSEDQCNFIKSGTGLMGFGKEYSDGYLGMVCDDTGINYRADLCAISPNNDYIRDEATVAITNIRNIKEIKMSVLNSEKEHIRTVGIGFDIRRKNYIELSENPYYKLENLCSTMGDSLIWDGKVYDDNLNKYVKAKDGQYYIQLEIKISDKFLPQIIQMPIKIDTRKPEVTDLNMVGNNRYQFQAKDDIAMDSYYYLYVDGMTEGYLFSELEVDENGNYIIDLSEYKNKDVYIMFVDIAGNEVVKKIDNDLEKDDYLYETPSFNNDDAIKDDFDTVIKFDEQLCEDIIVEKEESKISILLKEDNQEEFKLNIIPKKGYSIKSLFVEGIRVYKEGEVIPEEFEGIGEEMVNVEGIDNGDNSYDVVLNNNMDWKYLYVYAESNTGSVYSTQLNIYRNTEKEEYMEHIIGREIERLSGTSSNLYVNESMINEDGTYTFKEKLNVFPDKLIINGNKVEVNKQTKEFEYKLLLNGGVNNIKIKVSNPYREYEIDRVINYSKFNVVLDGIEDENKIINSDKATFIVKGKIQSYITGYIIKINNDIVYSAHSYYDIIDGRGDIDIKEFAYELELKKGINEIKLEVAHHGGEKIIKKIRVMY